MLIGNYFVKLTAKGRLAVPSKFREEIGEKGVLARFYQGCLVLMGTSRWNQLLSNLISKSEDITQPVQDEVRFILGSAFEVEMDKQGRFVVPQILRNFAKIQTEVVFLGLGDRVEIWDKETWKTREEQSGKSKIS